MTMKRLPSVPLICLLSLVCLLSVAGAVWVVADLRLTRDFEAGIMVLETWISRAVECVELAIASPDEQTRTKLVAGVSGVLEPAGSLLHFLTYHGRRDPALTNSVANLQSFLLALPRNPTDEQLMEMHAGLSTLAGLISAARTDGRTDHAKLIRSLRNLKF